MLALVIIVSPNQCLMFAGTVHRDYAMERNDFIEMNSFYYLLWPVKSLLTTEEMYLFFQFLLFTCAICEIILRPYLI